MASIATKTKSGIKNAKRVVSPEVVSTAAELDFWSGRIHQGDSIELMSQLPSKCIDLVVTSPPYNLKNSTGNGLKDGRGGKWPTAGLIAGYATHDDNMPYEKYVNWQRNVIESMLRITKDNGAIFYNHKWRVQDGLLQDRHEIVSGFPVRQIIIWKRAGGINFNPGYFLPTYEVIYLIAKKGFRLASGANSMGDIWEIPQTRGIDHPAPFPIELARRCITASPGGIVLDPFMGSGTTAIAAIEENRPWIGIELSSEYVQLAERRIAAFHGNARPRFH